ncbi:MAG TPA: LytTR family DNA-binding domain-containing protein [Saprospiraceae bacterium]|nr:LytTR family DNA-binding domain-containing protein [Saprospiraceae bacterium]
MSSPLNIVIIDDEPGSRAMIRSLLERHFPDLIIAGEAAGVEESWRLINEVKPDIVFLDVEMEDGTGFDLLNRAGPKNFTTIFTTAHNEFAIKAFRYNAIDYLLKPIDPDDFQAAVNKAIQFKDFTKVNTQIRQLIDSAKNQTFEKITLNTSDGLVFANTNDILRMETYGNYTFVYMQHGERLLVSMNLKEFEEILPEPQFFRIHQSHIVNTSFVKKFIKGEGDHVIMNDGSKIPVSRRRKDEFTSVLMGKKS